MRSACYVLYWVSSNRQIHPRNLRRNFKQHYRIVPLGFDHQFTPGNWGGTPTASTSQLSSHQHFHSHFYLFHLKTFDHFLEKCVGSYRLWKRTCTCINFIKQNPPFRIVHDKPSARNPSYENMLLNDKSSFFRGFKSKHKDSFSFLDLLACFKIRTSNRHLVCLNQESTLLENSSSWIRLACFKIRSSNRHLVWAKPRKSLTRHASHRFYLLV